MIINPSLDNINKALAASANPHHCFKTIQIAGTNGKGSVCSFLELLYKHCLPHIKVGKYLSPHLISVTERILVKGSEIELACFNAISEALEELCQKYQLTYFEKLTLIAFQYFKEQEIDLAILETGLGGRWDATNTIPAENRLATAITNISWDHMDYLGDSLEKIRFEKEGIKREAVAHFEGEKFASNANPNSINGQNFLLALEIFETINKQKVSQLIKELVVSEFQKHYQGRLQYFPEKKLLLDGAHNPASAKILNQFICKQTWASEPKIWHLAFMQDKDYKSFCENLFHNLDISQDCFICHSLDEPRALSSEILCQYLLSLGLQKACQSRSSNPTIVTGSLYLVGKWIEENLSNSSDLAASH